MKQNISILAADRCTSTWGNDWVYSASFGMYPRAGLLLHSQPAALFPVAAGERSGSYSSSSAVSTTPHLYPLLLRRREHKLGRFV